MSSKSGPRENRGPRWLAGLVATDSDTKRPNVPPTFARDQARRGWQYLPKRAPQEGRRFSGANGKSKQKGPGNRIGDAARQKHFRAFRLLIRRPECPSLSPASAEKSLLPFSRQAGERSSVGRRAGSVSDRRTQA